MSISRRIAFLSEHASPVALLGGEDAGGQNVYVDEVSRNLAARGYIVDVFTRRDRSDLADIIEWAPGVRVIHLTAGPATFLPKDALWPLMPEFRDALLHFIQQEGLHYDLIHSNFWMSGWVAAELRQRLSLPIVHIFHAMGKTKRRHQGSVDSSPEERIAIEYDVVRGVDRIIAQCPSEWEELVDDYAADPERVVVIPSAVNSEVFRPVPHAEARRVIGADQDELLVVYVGRIIPRKDIRNVVRAMACLISWYKGIMQTSEPPVRLMIVGGETVEPDPAATPEIGELQRLAQELGVLDYVRFVGKRQQDKLRYYYSAGDVVVTTPWYEPFGLTPLEAMACGRPVIGSAVGGITYTLVDGETGFLVRPREPELLAVRLYQLLTQPQLRKRMGHAARRRVEQEFTWSVVAERTAALYESLLLEREQEYTVPEEAAGPTFAQEDVLADAMSQACDALEGEVDSQSVGGGE